MVTLRIYQDIGMINSISGPTMSRTVRDSIDVSTMSERCVLPFNNAVTFNMTITWNTYCLLKRKFKNADKDNYEIRLSESEGKIEEKQGASKDLRTFFNRAFEKISRVFGDPIDEKIHLNFVGAITELPLDIPKDSSITTNITIKVLGPISWSNDSHRYGKDYLYDNTLP